jgi:hypothetical protein
MPVGRAEPIPFSAAMSMTDQELRKITPTTPFRLADAVKIAFPMGGMTVAGLRRERDRNRLIVEKIAGKEFTTLAHIERMRELCRDEAREPDSSLRQPAATRADRSPIEQPGSSETTVGMSAQAALQMRLQPRKQS